MSKYQNISDEIVSDTMADAFVDALSKLPSRAQEILIALMIKYPSKNNDIANELLFLDYTYHGCKSPIETIFFVAYMYKLLMIGFPESELLYPYKQEEIKTSSGRKYYADFLIDTETVKGLKIDAPLKLVIECDGHEFHERTKQQVESANNRDYELKILGYEVLHFSGSQIYKDPVGCADKVLKYAMSKVGVVSVDNDFLLKAGEQDGTV